MWGGQRERCDRCYAFCVLGAPPLCHEKLGRRALAYTKGQTKASMRGVSGGQDSFTARKCRGSAELFFLSLSRLSTRRASCVGVKNQHICEGESLVLRCYACTSSTLSNLSDFVKISCAIALPYGNYGNCVPFPLHSHRPHQHHIAKNYPVCVIDGFTARSLERIVTNRTSIDHAIRKRRRTRTGETAR